MMTRVRGVERVQPAYATIEGAGVRLHRAFGYEDVPLFDPFLMLDDFRAGTQPEDYLAGFPWHPHRGIETVTYMLEGKIEHGDSMGNAGIVNAGDIQWMTAGSGIIHQEMPKPVNGVMGGFQLWMNLPRSKKMMDPRYQEIKRHQVPVATPQPGVEVTVICGTVSGVKGPVEHIVADPEYLDITLRPDTGFLHKVGAGYTAAAYVIGGKGYFDDGSGSFSENRDMILFGDGDSIKVRSSPEGVRFLFFSGKSIREPVAWGGPVVMNTPEELAEAFREYRDGTFIKKKGTTG
ncbi:MAG: pirin family protein [Methanoregula sp.]|uniref:pirin family protein n=2 Tax=Methanoregula sp. TaxID=2052170 RepID=UPI003C53DCFF